MSSIGESILNPTTVLSAVKTFVYLLIAVVTLWYVYFRMSRKRMYELAAKIPGPKYPYSFPIIGCAHKAFGTDSNAIFELVYERSFDFPPGSPVAIWIGPRLFVGLSDPRDTEVILSSNVHLDKGPEYTFFEPWLGNGLLISKGEKWHADRKLIAPTFHLNVLKTFINLMNKNSLLAVEKMKKEGSKEFDVHHYMSECTVEILLETVMGVDKKTQEASGFEYATAVMKMCDIIHVRHYKIWLRPDFIFNLTKYAKEQVKLLDFIHGLTINVMKKKKQEILAKNANDLRKNKTVPELTTSISKPERKEITDTVEGSSFGQAAGLKDDLDVDDDIGQKKRPAFLDLLMESAENGLYMTDNEVREQVDTIMFEGHDTTASASSFFLCVMGARPDIQDKVVEELEQIFGDSKRPVTYQDTLEMKYMERCIMETLRLYPPVPIIARQLHEEVQIHTDGLILPANCTVVACMFLLHRNSNIYPNPNEFDPDHFLPEKTSERHYYAFTPFSAGPRSCVGRKYAMLKLKILLATILRNYKVHSSTKLDEWKLQADIILKRADGFNIQLEPRKLKLRSAKG